MIADNLDLFGPPAVTYPRVPHPAPVSLQIVDLVEETAQMGLLAFELKRDPKKAQRAMPKTFRSAYPDATCCGISTENVAEFLI